MSDRLSVSSPKTASCAEAWRRHAELWATTTGGVPVQSSLLPTALRGLLPVTALIDAACRDRPRFRVWGTELVARFRAELTGRLVPDHLPGEVCADVLALLARVVDTPSAVLCDVRVDTTGGRGIYAELLLLPLRSSAAVAPDRIAAVWGIGDSLDIVAAPRGGPLFRVAERGRPMQAPLDSTPAIVGNTAFC